MTSEFEFTEELVELRSMVREFCAEFSPESVVRTTMESARGFDPGLWRRLGSELGVLGLSVPEEYGGADAGLVAQAVVVEELGAALVCGPVVGTLALAIPVLCALDDDETRAELLPDLCSGQRIATLVAPLDDGGFHDAAVTVTGSEHNGGWHLEGRAAQVPDAVAADVLLVVATTPEGLGLFAVDGDAEGVSRRALTTMDLTRQQGEVDVSLAPARLLARGDDVRAAVEHAARVGATLLAAEQVGGSQRMLDMTVAHVSTRRQFGQPVGAYQAVKHRCANMLMAVEQARSTAYHAAWALQDGLDDTRLAASLAKAIATETFSSVTAAAIQLHGGLGFTWEGSPQLYFKRATADAATLGSAAQHIERVARFALDDVPLLLA